MPETTATVAQFCPPDANCRNVSLSRHGQQGLTAKAQVVLAADGLGHVCLRHVDMFQSRTVANGRVGLGLIVNKHEAYESGAIHMAIGQSGYVGRCTADEHLNVAAAVDPDALRATDTPGELINRILADAGLPALSLDATSSWRGTLPLSRATSRLAGKRIFLLGDAAGYVEPFTGEGMGWAIDSAISVVPYVMRLQECWDEAYAQQWETAQRRKMAQPGHLSSFGHVIAATRSGQPGTKRANGDSFPHDTRRATNPFRAIPFASEPDMSVLISGMGTSVPEYQIEQSDAAEQASQLSCQTLAQQRLLKTLYRRAGVQTRRSVLLESGTNGRPAEQGSYMSSVQHGPTTAERMAAYELHAAPLAIAAAPDALSAAKVGRDEITHLVTVCAAAFLPGVDLAMMSELSLPLGTSPTHVGFMGCHGGH